MWQIVSTIATQEIQFFAHDFPLQKWEFLFKTDSPPPLAQLRATTQQARRQKGKREGKEKRRMREAIVRFVRSRLNGSQQHLTAAIGYTPGSADCMEWLQRNKHLKIGQLLPPSDLFWVQTMGLKTAVAYRNPSGSFFSLLVSRVSKRVQSQFSPPFLW